MAVVVTRSTLVLPTYEPAPPERHPMFFEHRVYQGSSGRVYPLPFYDRIAERPEPHEWAAVVLENEYLRVTILPALGGRIHRIFDKTHDFDVIYHQPVIKPALVGLAGPWVSGGIEFNWPQHHRPSTYLPADVHVEAHADGSATVWLSEHEPMARMKGMHGVCLHPRRAEVEVKVRVSNRTEDVQTFLWWVNAGIRVHERYQSFFPPDVSHVVDHAKRAVSTFPRCTGRYYGVNYAERARSGVPADERPAKYRPPEPPLYPPNDLAWYANIPVPTSYMAVASSQDFFGGYDHAAEAGLIHVADHRIAPGKKQWTWGNHEFGYAWDRNLTDPDAQGEHPPYIELMAGVFTDNQPDFSFLQPGETRTWTQSWFPFRRIGPAQQAGTAGAISLVREGPNVRLGVAVTAEHPGAAIRLRGRGDRVLKTWRGDLSPARPQLAVLRLGRHRFHDLSVVVEDREGTLLLTYRAEAPTPANPPAAAVEPLPPSAVASADELFLTGLHLEQYRHATRSALDYWAEALRRDPGDSRVNLAVGRWHLRRGEFDAAERHLRTSLARLTARNPNPADGEAYFQLGRCLRYQARPDEAADAFAKAAWNQAWASAGHHALAELAARRAEWPEALRHLDQCLVLNADHLRARNLRAMVLRRLGRRTEAGAFLSETLQRDPLDWWARHLRGEPLACDAQVRMDLAWDLAQAGFAAEALDLLGAAAPSAEDGTAPLVSYLRAWLCDQLGQPAARRRHLRAARHAARDRCFPSRLDEYGLLRWAVAAEPGDALAHQLLGFWLYDRRRHEEAMRHWEAAVRAEPANAVVWRCLGIGNYNQRRRPAAARRAYERAIAASPDDGRLWYERDQLWKRLRVAPARRLRTLESRWDLVRGRDDLAVEACALLNQVGRPQEAVDLLQSRRFQPWEGGEGGPLGQHQRAHLRLGRAALERGDPAQAREEFAQALASPANLGEARHLLANAAEADFSLGEALAALGQLPAARRAWRRAARRRGDFQAMAVQEYSENSYFSALAWRRLGQPARARRILEGLLAYARRLRRQRAVIDYFATSLPAMLLFQDDLSERQQTHALLLEAQARLGLGAMAPARRLLREVLRRDPAHALAADLLRQAANGRQPDHVQ